jgi:hypothetical protein
MSTQGYEQDLDFPWVINFAGRVQCTRVHACVMCASWLDLNTCRYPVPELYRYRYYLNVVGGVMLTCATCAVRSVSYLG